MVMSVFPEEPSYLIEPEPLPISRPPEDELMSAVSVSSWFIIIFPDDDFILAVSASRFPMFILPE